MRCPLAVALVIQTQQQQNLCLHGIQLSQRVFSIQLPLLSEVALHSPQTGTEERAFKNRQKLKAAREGQKQDREDRRLGCSEKVI